MKRNNSLKRSLAFLLCVAMMITYMPSPVYTLADESVDSDATVQEESAPTPAPEKAAEPAPAPEPAPAVEEKAPEPEPALAVEEKAAETESAQDDQAVDAAPAEETASEEKEDKDETEYPAITLKDTAGDVDVEVKAPEGALPEGTTASFKAVAASEVEDAVKAELGENAEVVKAVDITFKDMDGKEIEPKKQVSVKFVSSEFRNIDDAAVVHIEDNGDASKVADSKVESSGRNVEFKAENFSVYAVVDQGENARLKVVFMLDEDTVLATEYVKESDFSDEHIGRIGEVLYDPGTGTLPAGVTFKGWTTDPDYDAGTTANTIEGIRNAAKNTSWSTIKDGDEEGGAVLTYYAMLFKYYVVSYTGEGVTLGHEQVFYPYDADNPNATPGCSYRVNQGFTPGDDQHIFDGWVPDEGADKISDAMYDGEAASAPYKNGTTMTITGSVEFAVQQSEGNWLVFDENGKGGTYNAPKFIPADDPTTAPTIPMVRNGYTFAGWYDSKEHADAHGNNPSITTGEFQFGGTISQKTTVYASWKANTSASYTVIFWTQNQARTGYEVKASLVRENATVGQTIQYSSVDNGDEDYVTGFGNDYGHYTGFCLTEASKNQQVTVTPEGDAVLNLYYDRIEYNFKFYLYRNGTQNNRYDYAYNSGNGSDLNGLVTWHSNQTEHPSVSGYTIQSETVGGRTYYYFVMSAYYGENISSKWLTYSQITGANGRDPVSYVMMVGTKLKPRATSSGSGTVKGTITILDENILGATNDKDGNYVVVRFPGDYKNWRYHIWYETVEGVDYTGKTTRTYNGKTYYEETVMEVRSSNTNVSEQNKPDYPGFDFVTKAGDNNNHTGFRGDDYWTTTEGQGSGRITFYHLNFIYNRQQYRINYFDGNYIDGDGNFIQNRGEHLIHESGVIGQGATIADEYRSYVPDLPSGEKGYVFEGWYLDEGCTTPYVWDKMPAGGIKVYAKWRQVQYRVFLHPNVPANDNTLDWGGSQAMNFRVSYDKQISAPTGTRTGYVFVGWFTDEACTEVFNDSTKLNETTVDTDYDKDTHMTDPMDKWGNGATTNGDLDRPWITKEFNLYAKWRAVLEDAEGIGVIYDKNGGSGTAEDTNLYVDEAKATAVGSVKAPSNKQKFAYWVMQKWDGQKYVDIPGDDNKIYPGESFVVKASNARYEEYQETVDGQEVTKHRYTIQLRAEYVGSLNAVPTHLKWYYNNGDDAFHIDKLTGSETDYNNSTLLTNEAVPIQGKPADSVKPGYEFKGWARVEAGRDADSINSFYNNEANYTQTGLTPYLFYKDNAFHIGSEDGKTATKIAADEFAPYHAMFGVWEPIEYDVRFNKNADDAEGTMADEHFIYDEEKELTANAFTRENYNFLGWSTDPADTTVTYTDKESVKNLTTTNGIVELYAVWEKAVAPVVVHHYLKGTTTKVADDVTTQETIGSEFTATPVATYQEKHLTVDSYNPSQTVTVSEDGNVITIYYTLPLTITAKNKTYTYSGSPQGPAGTYTEGFDTYVKVDGLLEGDALTSITLKGSQTYVNVYENEIVPSAAVVGDTTYYTFNYVSATLTIEKADQTLSVESADHAWPYDAQSHTYKVYTVTYGTEKIEGTEGQTVFTLSTGDKVTVTPTGKGASGVKNVSDSGANSFTWTVENEGSYTKGTDKVGTLTINKVDITIAMADRTLPYNGKTQYGWARTDAGKETVTGLVHNETVTITYSPSSGKTAGTYTNGAYTESSLQIKDGDTDVTENYNLTSATAGKLKIEKDEKELKVESASKDWDYDAGTHTYKVYTVTYGTEKIEGTEGQTVFTLSTGDKVTVTPTGKGASGVKNVSDSGANSFTWTVENEGSYTKGTDKAGTLTINKAPLTITTPSGTKVYDGTPITRPNGTVTGLVNGETATVTGTGSQTAVGSSQNGYKIVWGSAKEANYEIVSENLGTLTVTAAPGGDDNPGGGGGPTVTPAGPGTPDVIPDEPTPTVDPPVDIVDPEPPLAEDTWALINLISAILTALGAAVALFRKKEEEDEEDEDEDNMYKSEDEDEDEDDNRGKKMFAAKVAGVLAGVAAPITFFLTEDMSLPMVMIDKWTVLMLIMLAVQVVAAVFNKKASELDDDEEEAEAQEA